MARVLKHGFIHGFHAIVLGQTHTGFRCGYVGVPASHPLYKRDYDEIDGPEVHGGLTFSGGISNKDSGDANLWYFGFDCGHSGDGVDISLLDKGHAPSGKFLALTLTGPVRTTDYVWAECEKLAVWLGGAK